MFENEARKALVFVWNYLRDHFSKRRNVTLSDLRREAVKMSASERGVDHTTEHRNLKIALGIDPIVGGCGRISDADRMLRELIRTDSEDEMVKRLAALRAEHPRAWYCSNSRIETAESQDSKHP